MSVFYTPFPKIVVLTPQERQSIEPAIRKTRKREFGIAMAAPVEGTTEELIAKHNATLADMNAKETERVSRLIAFRLDWSEIDAKRFAEIAQPYGYLFEKIVFAAEPETLLNLGHLEGLYRSAERTSAVWHGDTALNEKGADAIFAYAKAYFDVLFDSTCAIYTDETTLIRNLAAPIAYYRWSFARHPRSAFERAIIPLRRSIVGPTHPESYQVISDFISQMVQVHGASVQDVWFPLATPTQRHSPKAEEGDPSKHLEDIGKQVIASMLPGFDVDGLFAKIKDALTENPAPAPANK
jgi:hypothetical protein